MKKVIQERVNHREMAQNRCSDEDGCRLQVLLTLNGFMDQESSKPEAEMTGGEEEEAGLRRNLEELL